MSPEDLWVRYGVCCGLSLVLALRLASAPAISGLECFWAVALTELDAAHVAWSLPSADLAGVVTRHAMFHEHRSGRLPYVLLIWHYLRLLDAWESLSLFSHFALPVVAAWHVLQGRMRAGFSVDELSCVVAYLRSGQLSQGPLELQPVVAEAPEQAALDIFYAPLDTDALATDEAGGMKKRHILLDPKPSDTLHGLCRSMVRTVPPMSSPQMVPMEMSPWAWMQSLCIRTIRKMFSGMFFSWVLALLRPPD